MPDHWQRLLFDVAEGNRQAGVSEREGTIHEVWSQNGEQKCRVNIGFKPDGTPWLTPWIHCEDHRGPHKQEEKYRKGQSVKVSTVGGDFRKAKITPAGENQEHQRPQHATDTEMTEQYDTLRESHGLDFHEHWLRKKPEKKKTEQKTPGTSDDQEKIKPDEKDDVGQAIALIRIGKKPKKAEDKNKAWEGPPKEGGDPQPIITIWAKRRSSSGSGTQAGESTDEGPPEVTADEVHIQYGDKSKSVISDGKIVHAIGALDKSGNLINEAMAAITTILGDKITHQVTNQSITTILQNLITHQVGQSVSTVMPNFITHIADRVDIKGNTVFAMAQQLLHTEAPIWKVVPAILHGIDWKKPTLRRKYGDDEVPDNPVYMTASMSSATAPNDAELGIPFNGLRWIDTTSGIEYSYYEGVWSEGGGTIEFPATPALDDRFTYQGRQWKWNGVGWESTLTHRVAAMLKRVVTYVVDGGGSVIEPGMWGYLDVPFDCQIKKATLLADVIGNAVIDVWKCSEDEFDAGVTHPVDGESITSATPMTITNAVKSQDVELSGWDKDIAAGDILAFNIDSCETITRITVSLEVEMAV